MAGKNLLQQRRARSREADQEDMACASGLFADGLESGALRRHRPIRGLGIAEIGREPVGARIGGLDARRLIDRLEPGPPRGVGGGIGGEGFGRLRPSPSSASPITPCAIERLIGARGRILATVPARWRASSKLRSSISASVSAMAAEASRGFCLSATAGIVARRGSIAGQRRHIGDARIGLRIVRLDGDGALIFARAPG